MDGGGSATGDQRHGRGHGAVQEVMAMLMGVVVQGMEVEVDESLLCTAATVDGNLAIASSLQGTGASTTVSGGVLWAR